MVENIYINNQALKLHYCLRNMVAFLITEAKPDFKQRREESVEVWYGNLVNLNTLIGLHCSIHPNPIPPNLTK
jgi:hypothetical protein